MEYTAKQIENAKRNYNAMLKMQTLSDYDVENIGRNTAEQRMDCHNGYGYAVVLMPYSHCCTLCG